MSANAALIRTYDARRLEELLDRVESAIESLEARNEGGEDTALWRVFRRSWQSTKRCGSVSDRQ